MEDCSTTTKAELSRQIFQPIRRLMLDTLKEHIREPGIDEAEPATIPFSESQSPLARYLLDTKVK